ncbi:MAG: hypothetical protein ACI8VC_002801 [Candidatus Endobugula sp.]|jgi:hypothetical protein
MSTFLLKKIADHQTTLEQHSFCQHLCQRQDISLQAYRFVPHMTFLVLGFRDILEAVKVAKPVSECELALNAHCLEDAEHWRLFIEDLQTLQMDTDYWGGDISTILSTLWSEEDYPIRELVYRVTHHIYNAQTPEEKMLIIECLESSFSIFITSLNMITHQNGYYKKLKYFGEEHYEDEANHTGGNWLEGEKSTQHALFYQVSADRVRHVNRMINDIFAGFDQVFHCWADALHINAPHISTPQVGTLAMDKPLVANHAR